MLEVDRVARTIYGRAVSYGVVALNQGWRIQHKFGSLHWSEPSAVKLLIRHDKSLPVGKAISLENIGDGLWARFAVRPGSKGDRALELAATTYNGLSVGLNDMTTVNVGGFWLCEYAELVEISLTPNPVYR